MAQYDISRSGKSLKIKKTDQYKQKQLKNKAEKLNDTLLLELIDAVKLIAKELDIKIDFSIDTSDKKEG